VDPSPGDPDATAVDAADAVDGSEPPVTAPEPVETPDELA
jgi:hypothetical protein